MYNDHYANIPGNRGYGLFGQGYFNDVIYLKYVSDDRAFYCPNISKTIRGVYGFIDPQRVRGHADPNYAGTDPTDYMGYFYLGGAPDPEYYAVGLPAALPAPAANKGFREVDPAGKLLLSDICIRNLTADLYLSAHPPATVWSGDIRTPDGGNQVYVDGHGNWAPQSALQGRNAWGGFSDYY
jgi:hypothetical protein